MSCTNHVPGAGDHLLAMHSVFELGPTCRNVLSCKRDTCQRSKVSLVVCLCRLSMPDIYPSSRWCPRGSIWASPCWTASADVPEPRSCPRRRLRDCGRAMVYLALTGVRPQRGVGGRGDGATRPRHPTGATSLSCWIIATQLCWIIWYLAASEEALAGSQRWRVAGHLSLR